MECLWTHVADTTTPTLSWVSDPSATYPDTTVLCGADLSGLLDDSPLYYKGAPCSPDTEYQVDPTLVPDTIDPEDPFDPEDPCPNPCEDCSFTRMWSVTICGTTLDYNQTFFRPAAIPSFFIDLAPIPVNVNPCVAIPPDITLTYNTGCGDVTAEASPEDSDACDSTSTLRREPTKRALNARSLARGQRRIFVAKTLPSRRRLLFSQFLVRLSLIFQLTPVPWLPAVLFLESPPFITTMDVAILGRPKVPKPLTSPSDAASPLPTLTKRATSASLPALGRQRVFAVPSHRIKPLRFSTTLLQHCQQTFQMRP
jgi:hypothetical protein